MHLLVRYEYLQQRIEMRQRLQVSGTMLLMPLVCASPHVIVLQVFGITHDPFIVYSSNMFAILSLRALYGFVNTIMSELRYLDKAVALVLGFIGAKMLADFGGYHVPTAASLGVVVTTLAGGVAASLWLPAKAKS